MGNIKSYTDLEQSKRLAEILPFGSEDGALTENYHCIPCWSLAALFDVLPKYIGDYGKCLYFDMGYYYCGYMVDGDFMLSIEETSADNPIDACVEMIIKLNEQKLL